MALFLRRRRVRAWLVLPVVATLPALLTTGDADAALAGSHAVGITTVGALYLGRRWWPPFALLGAGVLLVLPLASDAYVAFGLLFAALAIGALGWRTAGARRAKTIAR